MRKLCRSGLAFGMSMLVSLSVCDLGRADDGKAGNDSKTATVKPVSESKPEMGGAALSRHLPAFHARRHGGNRSLRPAG